MLLVTYQAKAQDDKPSKGVVEWKKLSEVQKLFEKSQRPIMIYFYKQNCDSCKMVDDSTFALAEVADFINVTHYAVRIDAESSEKVTFFDGKIHTMKELKEKLVGADISLPAYLFFTRDANGAIYNGYKSRNYIFPLLTYYYEDIHKSVGFEDYQKNYFVAYPPGQATVMTRLMIKWKTWDEAMRLNAIAPKKILVDFYANWRTSSTVMMLATYNNPKIAAYINNNYYPVRFDSQATDTLALTVPLAFNDSINLPVGDYLNKQESHKYHQFAIEMLGGRMTFPTLFFIDGKEMKVLERVLGFFTPESIEPMLVYYAENHHINQNVLDFLKTFKTRLFEDE